MGRLGKNFRRWPHTCEIYSVEGETSFADGEKVIIWRGLCRKEITSQGQGHENVLNSDYRVNLGEVVDGKEIGAIVPGIKAGMFIDVTDLQGTSTLTIKDAYAGNLGTSVSADKIFN